MRFAQLLNSVLHLLPSGAEHGSACDARQRTPAWRSAVRCPRRGSLGCPRPNGAPPSRGRGWLASVGADTGAVANRVSGAGRLGHDALPTVMATQNAAT